MKTITFLICLTCITLSAQPLTHYTLKAETSLKQLVVRTTNTTIMSALTHKDTHFCTGTSRCFLDKWKALGGITQGCALLQEAHAHQKDHLSMIVYVPVDARTLSIVFPKKIFNLSCISLQKNDSQCVLYSTISNDITATCS